MSSLRIEDVSKYVEDNIGTFHSKRLERLNGLRLREILKRKNPYLFKAKNILTSQDIVKVLLDAYLSSQEETIFGGFLEKLAIFVCKQVYGGGDKSCTEGLDLEFEKDSIKYIVTIKSGPNWADSGQIKNMKDNFLKAKKILRTNAPIRNIVAVCGCCYGRDNKPDKGEYLKLCGQRFWKFISGNDDLYTDIIEPLGHKARERNEKFVEAYAQIINKFTVEFAKDFCEDGKINWEKLVKFNSSEEPPRKVIRRKQ
jgi:hypothetical protein